MSLLLPNSTLHTKKDRIIWVSTKDTIPAAEDELDWDSCPCIKKFENTPCKKAFAESFLCYQKSKGNASGCQEQFQNMITCFSEHRIQM